MACHIKCKRVGDHLVFKCLGVQVGIGYWAFLHVVRIEPAWLVVEDLS